MEVTVAHVRHDARRLIHLGSRPGIRLEPALEKDPAPHTARMTSVPAPVLRTAGFALAHACGSISIGGTLCTLAIIQQGERMTIGRYEAPSIPESIAAAHGHLADILADGHWAALVYDGYVTSSERARTDALVAEIILPVRMMAARITQAYRPARRLGLPVVVQQLRLIGDLILDAHLTDEDASTIEDGMREHRAGVRFLQGRM